MNKTEQGVLQQSKLKYLLIHILLLLIFCLTYPAFAETRTTDTAPPEKNTKKHHVFIIFSPDNILHSSIVQMLSDNLNNSRSDITISKVTPEEKIKNVNNKTDLIVGMGYSGMRNADKHYPKTKKLFISTDPNKYRLDTKKNKNDAILYMTQPYCRQIAFIKQLNIHWKTISVIDSQEKTIDSAPLQKCAKKHGIKIYTVHTTSEDNLTTKIKKALRHSDVLLALPDSNIYNNKTVKNILLTSYRHRKPVIAFSKSFVTAGALASIHSNTDQIAHSASKLVEQYFDAGNHFKKPINYSETFDININKQVFRALNLSIPDIDSLKQSLQHDFQDNTGGSL